MYKCIYVNVCVYIYMCVCVCVCVYQGAYTTKPRGPYSAMRVTWDGAPSIYVYRCSPTYILTSVYGSRGCAIRITWLRYTDHVAALTCPCVSGEEGRGFCKKFQFVIN